MDIEQFAIRAAKGNNGGEWATHYTEEQKEYWRQFVRELFAAERERCANVCEEIANHREQSSAVWLRLAAEEIRKGE